MQRIQVGVKLLGASGVLPDSALEEITGECGFGEHEQVGGFGGAGQVPEDHAQLSEIVLVRTLVRAELDYRQVEHGGNLKGAGEQVRALRMEPPP
jgi:hypothetical protein